MRKAVDRLASSTKRGDLEWVRREMNYLKHCLVNVKSKLSYAEKQMTMAVKNNPHVVVGEVDHESVGMAQELMKVMFERWGKPLPSHVLEGLENQIKMLVEEFGSLNTGKSWQLALVFELEGSGETREVHNWMPVVVPVKN